MQDRLEKITQEILLKLPHVASLDELKDLERSVFGKTGTLTEILKSLKDLSDEDKKIFGKSVNELKTNLAIEFKNCEKKLEFDKLSAELENDWLDTSASFNEFKKGHVHPLYKVQMQVEKIFKEMGFAIIDGPEVESEFYNFEALNIAKHHPARDMQDTFFIDKSPDEKHGHLVLRTHTSPNQIRAMHKYGAPLRIVVPGRVFRNEATDASHEHTFDQVEGLLIDENISLAHLKGVMTEFLSKLFEREMKIRFRPGYFPFVEPGMELDMSCIFCNEAGCRVCKHSGWIEFMGCGMVHPKVLEAGKVDSKKYQGWAFGFGLTRLVMMKYGIDDIRHLTSGDLRFNKQF